LQTSTRGNPDSRENATEDACERYGRKWVEARLFCDLAAHDRRLLALRQLLLDNGEAFLDAVQGLRRRGLETAPAEPPGRRRRRGPIGRGEAGDDVGHDL
jgi:hypothetical protein